MKLGTLIGWMPLQYQQFAGFTGEDSVVITNDPNRTVGRVRIFRLNDESLADLNDYSRPASHLNTGNAPFA